MDTTGVKELVRQELRRIKTEDKKFHSPHEAWAILTEEVEEADKELAKVITGNTLLKDMVFDDYKPDDLKDQLKKIKRDAVNLSAEAVQVAAVAEKFMDFLENRESKTWSEFFDEWKDKDVAMHCKTEAEAREFCNIMKNQGMVWRDESSYDKTEYNCYGEETCYYFNRGMYGHCECAEEDGYTILEFSDYKELIDE